MLHREVFNKFENMFHIGTTTQWWQNGYNSVRIEFQNKKQVVFTYNSDTHWSLVTVASFLDSLKKK